MQTIAELLAQELGASPVHVQNVIDLLDQGNTIPFIARYRKELHGSMDDTALRKLEDRLTYLRNLEQRRQEVKSAIEGQEKLTPELAAILREWESVLYNEKILSIRTSRSRFCSSCQRP